MSHQVYGAIVNAVRSGRLREPFTKMDFQAACPGFGRGTYNAFLDKHALGNPSKTSELFRRTAPGKFECLRPFKYDL